MDDNRSEDEFNQWFSSYGLITAERILSRFSITLAPKIQLIGLKNPNSFFNRLIQAPLKNVLNGIILQQGHDYHVYTQKLFIDYLLSGESGKSEEEQGGATRESIEKERQNLVNLGELYSKKLIEHEALISLTQSTLIKATKQWSQLLEKSVQQISPFLEGTSKGTIKDSIVHALIHCEKTHYESQTSRIVFVDKLTQNLNLSIADAMKEKVLMQLADLLDNVLSIDTQISGLQIKVNEMRGQARSFRQQFYDTALRVIELINNLPDYKIDPIQDAINRESLYLDNTIGDN